MPQISPHNALNAPLSGGLLPAKAALRRLLLAQRFARTATVQQALACDALRAQLLEACLARTRAGEVVALYCAHWGEPELLAITQALQAAQRIVALPVVQAKGTALQFARWDWGDALRADAYGIAVPAQQVWVIPQCVVLPCVGFAVQQGHYFRLGYGGGFYDRSLAALRLENVGLPALGVAYASSRCVFEPDAHDVALNAVLTL